MDPKFALLEKLCRAGGDGLTLDSLTPDERGALHVLRHSAHATATFDHAYVTPGGVDALNRHHAAMRRERRDDIRWLVTTAISVAALIVAIIALAL